MLCKLCFQIKTTHKCDMINKGNKSDVADIVFEILVKKEFKFLCFILFSVLINCSLTQFASKRSTFELPESGVKISELNIFDMRLDHFP